MAVKVKVYLRQSGVTVTGTSQNDKDFAALCRRLIGSLDSLPPGFLQLENDGNQYLINTQAIDCILPDGQSLPPNEERKTSQDEQQKLQEVLKKGFAEIVQQLEMSTKTLLTKIDAMRPPNPPSSSATKPLG